ncbi:MAG: CAP domain-containing protein [Patescibacteria group bacterium]
MKQKLHKRHPLIRALLALLALGSFFLVWKTPRTVRKHPVHYWHTRSSRLMRVLKDYVIPHEGNDHKPKALHGKAVQHVLVVVLLVKIAIVGTLFILFPNPALLTRDIRSDMYRLINEYRSSKGLQELSLNSSLEEFAYGKGQDMLQSNYFSHFGPDGKKPWQWIDIGTYDFKSMGENLAMDFLTAESVLTAFQKSPTHDRNLLQTAYSDIGVAVLNGYLDGHETNLMVVFFGSPKIVQAAAVPAAPEPSDALAAPETTAVVSQVPKEPALAPEPVFSPVAAIPTPEPIAEVVSETTEAAPQEAPISFSIRPFIATTETEVLGEAINSDISVQSDAGRTGIVFAQGDLMQRVMAWGDRFFGLILAIVLVLFAINVFVKIRIQHAAPILNATLMIIVVALALYLNAHRVEAIGETIRILAQSIL